MTQMFKRSTLMSSVLAILLLVGCAASTDWVSHFVVYDGELYELTTVYTEQIGERIGKVTRYSDREGTYRGTFSNYYKKGTKLYAIQGRSDAIAIEEKGRYRIAVSKGAYNK